MTTESDQTTTAHNDTNAEAGDQDQQTEKPTILTEEKAPEAEKPEGEKPEGEKVEGAPEKYEDFTFPEGMKVDPGMLDKFTGMAKDLNLPQTKAQELMDMASEHAKLLAGQQQEQWAEIREGWVKDLKEDKEFGGDKFNETCDRARRVLKKYGSEKLADFLESTGYGDNSELIRTFARIDKATGEDKVVDGGPSGESNMSLAEKIYGNK